jgi:hypothetical protein
LKGAGQPSTKGKLKNKEKLPINYLKFMHWETRFSRVWEHCIKVVAIIIKMDSCYGNR